MEIAIIVLAGFLLDLIFGDPRWLIHPICLIGKLIEILEKILRKVFGSGKKAEVFAGILLNVVVLAFSFAVPYGILHFCEILSPWLAYAVETFFCYQIFAAKSLKTESMRVYNYLKKHDIVNSRKYLSWIVGRDTENLNEEQITKAVVETVAENTSDGVIAPMIFMIIGGAPLGFLYKGVNTLDSMVGYKNKKYINFGKFSAKVDDVFNFIPAIITGLFMILAAYMLGFDGKNGWRIFKRDRKNHGSPNSGKCESACAGALGIQLAGNAYYFGQLYEKKSIGDGIRTIEAEDIVRANKLMYGTAIISIIFLVAVRIAVMVII